MMVVREKQMNTLSQFMLKQFIRRMTDHLRRCFPENTQDIENATLQTMVKIGIKQAEEYGVTMEGDVRNYLECMIIYSPDFDTNPETPWGADILKDENLNGTEKMDRIDNIALFSRMD